MQASDRVAKPVFKWAGSKRFLAPEILSRLPARINTYYEPFLGGGAVFFALAAESRFKRAVINDANQELVETYAALAHEPDAVIEQLSKHVYEKDHYYAVRASQPTSLAARAARMIYLNKSCFNGLYRVNKSGQFNVPFGRYTNPTICDRDGLLAVSDALRGHNVTMTYADFEASTSKARKGDAVYYDPPYVPASATSNFTAYSAGGFSEGDHVRLWSTFRSLDKRGVHVLLSNSDTPFVRKLYDGFKIEEVQAPRRVNSKGSKRGNVTELLISGRK